MSTYLYPACISHEPFLIGGGELETHVSIEVLDRIYIMIMNFNPSAIEFLDRYSIVFEDPGVRAYHRFVQNHYNCSIAVVDEYGMWYQMKDELPENLKSKISTIQRTELKVK